MLKKNSSIQDCRPYYCTDKGWSSRACPKDTRRDTTDCCMDEVRDSKASSTETSRKTSVCFDLEYSINTRSVLNLEIK